MRQLGVVVLFICAIIGGSSAKVVRCDRRDLAREVARAKTGEVLEIQGDCILKESLLIEDSIILQADGPASITGVSTQPVILVSGANKVSLIGLTIQGGSLGILVTKRSGLLLQNSVVTGNSQAIRVDTQSTLELDGSSLLANLNGGVDLLDNSAVIVFNTVTASGSTAGFAFSSADSSSINLRPNSTLFCNNNLFGFQATSGSSVFLGENALLNTSGNSLIGLSINVGASLVLFRGNVVSNNNRLDGASVAVDASVFIDQTSAFVANNNTRDGLRVEQAVVRVSNLFGTPGQGPLIQTQFNGRRGTSFSRDSFLDLAPAGPIRGLLSTGNPLDDVFIEFSSSATLRSLSVGKVTLSFGARVDFGSTPVNTNSIGTLVCSGDVVTRGTIACP